MPSRLIIALVGCSSTPPDTARIYAESATLAQTDPAAAADRCEALPADVSDECLSFAARAAAPSDPDLAASICERTRPSLWQDECWFLVAEALVPTHGGKEAVRACTRAERFAGNCLDHVWRAHASALLAQHDPATAVGIYADARVWSEGIVPNSKQRDSRQVDGRFWQKFYDAPLHDADLPPLDLAWCATMPANHRRTCEQTLPSAFRRTLVRLEREARTKGAPIDARVVCDTGRDVHTRITEGYGITYVSGERLDALGERQISASCGRPASQAQQAGDRPRRHR